MQASARFWLKGQPYSLHDMLRGHYLDRFVGGDVFQSFLSGADYHRWRAPIAGTVRHVEKVDGLMFSDAESAGVDTTAATFSQGFEASVNTRGLVFIESPDPILGMVWDACGGEFVDRSAQVPPPWEGGAAEQGGG